ncbi:hypothetical protein DVH24_042385 [Malus domestica]|uniref:Uncharacterized protein n=1 Tax=Malus domestica TaxID=3750 RepID=A0A498J1T1_MALDO|nr:hypothetical protein DVH24_042385 [Malus domestica]
MLKDHIKELLDQETLLGVRRRQGKERKLMSSEKAHSQHKLHPWRTRSSIRQRGDGKSCKKFDTHHPEMDSLPAPSDRIKNR